MQVGRIISAPVQKVLPRIKNSAKAITVATAVATASLMPQKGEAAVGGFIPYIYTTNAVVKATGIDVSGNTAKITVDALNIPEANKRVYLQTSKELNGEFKESNDVSMVGYEELGQDTNGNTVTRLHFEQTPIDDKQQFFKPAAKNIININTNK